MIHINFTPRLANTSFAEVLANVLADEVPRSDKQSRSELLLIDIFRMLPTSSHLDLGHSDYHILQQISEYVDHTQQEHEQTTADEYERGYDSGFASGFDCGVDSTTEDNSWTID